VAFSLPVPVGGVGPESRVQAAKRYAALVRSLAAGRPAGRMGAVNASAWVLLVVFLAVAAFDWIGVHLGSKPVEYVAKPGCMLVLIGAALAMDPSDEAARTALVVALVLSMVGDIFLMLPGREQDSAGPNLFVAGLAAFLLAHVAYVVGFVLDGIDVASLLLGLLPLFVLVVFAARPIIQGVKSSDEADLEAPVTAYIGVISAMVLAAFGTGDVRAMAGAVLFAFSDSLIALGRFVRPRDWFPLTIIITYHLAQALLTVSFT
jgi:uncharacterized membrane protein YhhN